VLHRLAAAVREPVDRNVRQEAIAIDAKHEDLLQMNPDESGGEGITK
jgi:hypothetical protein